MPIVLTVGWALVVGIMNVAFILFSIELRSCIPMLYDVC